jgi:hypothetical protein
MEEFEPVSGLSYSRLKSAAFWLDNLKWCEPYGRQPRELEMLKDQQRENERLANERREKNPSDAERLEAEKRQREGRSNGKATPSSHVLSQDRSPAKAGIPAVIQSQGSATPKALMLRASLVVCALILIVEVIWLARSKQDSTNREVALLTLRATPESASAATPQSEPIPKPTTTVESYIVNRAKMLRRRPILKRAITSATSRSKHLIGFDSAPPRGGVQL